jgi:DNA polymerase III sliding clamp (beta) subunit (PCNA family)
MTAVQELERTETGEIVATVVPAVELRNALSACLLAVSKDKTLPVLEAVHVAKVGDVLTFRATDRYRLVQVTITLGGTRGVTPEGDWETLIDAADVKRIVGMLPKVAAHLGHVRHDRPNAVSLPAAGSLQFTPVDGEFPRVATIIPTATAPVEEIGFNPSFLADARQDARFREERAGAFFQFNGPGKPAVGRWTDDKHDEVAYLYLLMPVRINS